MLYCQRNPTESADIHALIDIAPPPYCLLYVESGLGRRNWGFGMNLRRIVAAACGIAIMGLGLLAEGASAADVSSRPLSVKRQLVMCMTKRMSDSRTLSYNDAGKLCKEQLEAQRVTLAQSVLAKPMAP